ncbi:MAG: helix-turn-helix transcriptional regulator [Oscillospiraceae bacterium]|nr:helix-turn-helix transcriptional regulator [Oscillospiraceae bacterium]
MGRLRAKDGKKNLVGPRVRALREREHLSQEALMAQLQLLGMDEERGVIKRIENGDRAVSDLEIQLFSQFFHVTYEYLIDGTEQD